VAGWRLVLLAERTPQQMVQVRVIAPDLCSFSGHACSLAVLAAALPSSS
jgi:hypothetical protein